MIEHGDDFQESREHAIGLAAERGVHMVPSFHADLMRGVITYWWEFLQAVPQTRCGLSCRSARARAPARPSPPSSRWAAALRIVGVVTAHATTYADSLAAGRVVEAPVTTQLADGMACRIADPRALDIMLPHIDHIVR